MGGQRRLSAAQVPSVLEIAAGRSDMMAYTRTGVEFIILHREHSLIRRQTLNPAGLFDSRQYGFSQAMVVEGGRRLLLSGQVGVDENEKTVDGGIGPQTIKALDNIGYLLEQAGGDLSHVAMLRIYIAQAARDDQEPIAEALRRYFPVNPPPSSWIIVAGLSLPEWLIEIEAEAVLP